MLAAYGQYAFGISFALEFAQPRGLRVARVGETDSTIVGVKQHRCAYPCAGRSRASAEAFRVWINPSRGSVIPEWIHFSVRAQLRLKG